MRENFIFNLIVCVLKSEHIFVIVVLVCCLYFRRTFAACVFCLCLFSLHSFLSYWPERECKNLLPSSFFFVLFLLFYFCGCGLCLSVCFLFVCLLFMYVVLTYLLLLVQIVRDGGAIRQQKHQQLSLIYHPCCLPLLPPWTIQMFTGFFLHHSSDAEYIRKRWYTYAHARLLVCKCVI